MIKLLFLFTLLINCTTIGYAQEPIDNWDNILYYSNTFALGTKSWRHSGEFQSRFENNLGSLEQWYVEYVATYLLNKNVEIVPDFRFTRKPAHTEIRPGIGLIYKNLFKKSQLIHQVKYQWDYESTGYSSHGFRYVVFYNHLLNKDLIATILAGGLFEFGDDFKGLLGIRTGFNMAYIFDEVHTINLGYFYGAVSENNRYTNIGIIMVRLVINLRKSYEFVPAKYINF